MRLSKLAWILFVFLAIAVGIYPFFYFVFDMSHALLSKKPLALLNSNIWKSFFYLHISFGGVALLIGWTQFREKIRNKNINLHRLLGKIYVVSVLISGTCGLYIALYSTGGTITHFGFGILAASWLYCTIKAYTSIRNKNITSHQQWMIRSYAFCFAAVTLRIWLPLLAANLGFDLAYKIVSWWCWIPNIIVAELMIRKASVKRLHPPFLKEALEV